MVTIFSMKYKNILVTGGAGFVGSHICLKLKEYFSNIRVIALDNLYRKGSELNVPRLEKQGVYFIKGDVRVRRDLEIRGIDLIIECSAEPSVMAGVTSSPEYLLDTNVMGAINCFETARKNNADVIFLSTSRVYPVNVLNKLNFSEEETRFALKDEQSAKGVSKNGISELFPLEGLRTLYGATKLSAEYILSEYIDNYGIKGIIDRCGLITGPWQMGKTDQGIITYWMAQHIFKRPLSYIGFGGSGKQVRDILDIDDLFNLLLLQLDDIEKYSGYIYNVGGGLKNSVSLLELTDYCQKLTGNKVDIRKIGETRKGDVRLYISDCAKIEAESGWEPKRNIGATLLAIKEWIVEQKTDLQHIL